MCVGWGGGGVGGCGVGWGGVGWGWGCGVWGVGGGACEGRARGPDSVQQGQRRGVQVGGWVLCRRVGGGGEKGGEMGQRARGGRARAFLLKGGVEENKAPVLGWQLGAPTLEHSRWPHPTAAPTGGARGSTVGKEGRATNGVAGWEQRTLGGTMLRGSPRLGARQPRVSRRPAWGQAARHSLQ